MARRAGRGKDGGGASCGRRAGPARRERLPPPPGGVVARRGRPPPAGARTDPTATSGFGEASSEADMTRDQQATTRERLREQLHAGRLDSKAVELETRDRSTPSFELIQGSSMEEIGVNLRDM